MHDGRRRRCRTWHTSAFFLHIFLGLGTSTSDLWAPNWIWAICASFLLAIVLATVSSRFLLLLLFLPLRVPLPATYYTRARAGESVVATATPRFRGGAERTRMRYCGILFVLLLFRWCGVVWCGVVWYGVVWCGVVWCGVVWCSVVWYVICGLLCVVANTDLSERSDQKAANYGLLRRLLHTPTGIQFSIDS